MRYKVGVVKKITFLFMTIGLAVALVACERVVEKPAPPTVAQEIDDMVFEASDRTARTVTLTGHFNADSPDYSARSRSASVATASVSGSRLTVTPVGAGTTRVDVTATDDNGKVTETFTVTVKAPEPPAANNPPTVRTIPDESLVAGDTETVTLSRYADDPEGDELTYSAVSNDDAVAMVAVAGAELTITAVAVGTAEITVTVSDGTNSVERVFEVTVTESPVPDNNQPYRTAPLPNLTGLTVSVSPDPIDLSNHFSDDEDDELEYHASSDNEGVVTVAVSGSMLTITVVAPGTATISVTVADDANNQVRGSFTVMVVNQAPMIVRDEPTRFGPYMPGDTQKITLAEYFTDAEADSLTYAAESDAPAVATLTGPDADSNITITAAGVGRAEIMISANDGTSTTPHVLTVTVSAVPNMAPVVSTVIPSQSLQLVVDDAAMTESASTTLDLMNHFSDPDDMPEPLAYSTDSDMAMIEGTILTIRADASDAGRMTSITVTASDGAAEISDTFDVMVASPEAPGTSSELPDQNFDHDDITPRTFMLSNFFSRATGYGLDIIGDANVVMAEEDGGVLTLTPVGSGRTVVEVTPSNSGGDGSSQTITVDVEAAPPTPVPTSIKPLQATITESDAAATKIELDEYFSGATSYEYASNNEAALSVSLSGHTLTLMPGTYGMATVTVTPVNDSGRGTSQTFNVTVRSRPVLEETLDDLRLAVPADPTVTGAVESLDLEEHFDDPDGSIEKYITETNDAEKLAVYVTRPTGTDDEITAALNDADEAEGSEVMLEARDAGTVTVTVTVTDDSGLVKEERFEVTIVDTNADPTTSLTANIASYIGATRFQLGDAPKKAIDNMPISATFGDTDLVTPAGDILKFTVKYVAADGAIGAADLDEDDIVATAVVSPDTWDGDAGGVDNFTITVTPVKEGAAHDILIIATDLAGSMGASGSEAFGRIQVQVNRPPVAEGYVAPDAPAGTEPNRLSDYTTLEGLSATQAEETYTIDLDGTSATDADSYFHDADEDTLACRAVPSVTGDTAPAVISMGTGNVLTVDPKSAYDTGFVPMTVTVDCRDGWGTGDAAVIGEYSDTQSFTVSITSASVH